MSTAYSLEDTAGIRVQDNGEPLVDVRKYCPNVVIRLDGERMKIEKTAYLRKSVAERLYQAQSLLPDRMTFVIRDAWRPAYVQCGIYFEFLEKAARRFPKVSSEKRKLEVEKYVAPWSGRNASGHMTGGAIDLRTLQENGRLLPMRSKQLSYQENALSDQPKLSGYLKKNRRILVDVMKLAGFSNYPLEFWHWTIGDFYWAKREGRKQTIYAPLPDHLDMYGNRKCPCTSGKIFKKCHGA